MFGILTAPRDYLGTVNKLKIWENKPMITLDNLTMNPKEYIEGHEAFHAGSHTDDNPYPGNDEKFRNWWNGWQDAAWDDLQL